MTFNLILLFIIGLAIGSFLNVLILRIDDLKSIINTRSHCPQCKKALNWYDLIPLVSFIVLQAKCRHCGRQISWQYPIVELITGLLFVFLGLSFGIGWALVYYLFIFSLLTVVFVYDLKTQTVPDVFLWIALAAAAVGGWYFGNFTLLSMVYGAIIGGGFLALLVFFSKEKWMGRGDVFAGLILGCLVGSPNALFGLMFAFIGGSVIGLVYVLVKYGSLKQAYLKDSLPFTPFIILATLFTLVYGKYIIDWYLGSIKM